MSGTIGQDRLGLIPFWARRILEIGDGAVGEAILRRTPDAQVVTVKNLGDLVDQQTAELGLFDAIVLTTALDASPLNRRNLTSLHDLLAPRGQLVASIKHAAHWREFARLLTLAPHEPRALDGSGHGLTWPQAAALFEDCGLRIQTVRTYGSDQANAPDWLEQLSEVARAAGADANAFLARVHIGAFLVRAARTEVFPRPPVHLQIMAFAPKLLHSRTRLPAKALATDPDFVVDYSERPGSFTELPKDLAKIAVLQRVFYTREKLVRLVSYARARGWLLVYEVDDHPELMARALKQPDIADRIEDTLSACHAVQTSTEELAGVIKGLNPEVHVFRNSVFDLPPWRPRAQVRRVFYGALNRGDYSAEVARALSPAIQARPELEFHVLHDRAFFEGLATPQKTFQPALDYPGYLRALEGCDVALCPLEGAPAEMFKSDIKFLELARSGAAAIASPAIYGATIRAGETGLIATSMEEWTSHLLRLVDDPPFRNRITRAAWEEVRAHRMAGPELFRLKDWYDSLIERRGLIDDGLLQRRPDLQS